MNLSLNPACIYSNIIKLTWRSKCPGKLYGLGQVYPAPLRLCTISASSSEKGWIKFWFQPFGLCSSPMLFFSLFSRLSRVPAAEDLASGMLTAFPQGLISVQDALLDGLFNPLPPQLYQVPAGKLSFDFILPRKIVFIMSFFYTLKVSAIHPDVSFLTALPSHSHMLQSLLPIANLTPCFSVFFHLTTVLIPEGDLDELPPWYICKVEVYMLR